MSTPQIVTVPEVGAKIDIEIKGATVTGVNGGTITAEYVMAGYDDEDLTGTVMVELYADAVTVTDVAPPYWPPQPGDVWRGPELPPDPFPPAFVNVWFARHWVDTDEGKEGLALVPAVGDTSYVETNPEKVRKIFGPLCLVHRATTSGQNGAEAGEDARPADGGER
ncbi:hypothetical protein ACFOWE_31250 [Planomonospora corallina]|uniref:Uncharacterized protein n=1 Tax=Planomonospora corallina TaxID=1806052 RepID=A0ABV8ILU8_9ACTN